MTKTDAVKGRSGQRGRCSGKVNVLTRVTALVRLPGHLEPVLLVVLGKARVVPAPPIKRPTEWARFRESQEERHAGRAISTRASLLSRLCDRQCPRAVR